LPCQGCKPVQPYSQEGSRPSPDLEALCARYSPPLLTYFRKRVRSHDEAEDLVQELFCRFASKSDDFTMDNPEAYIFQTAANLLRDRARRAKVRTLAVQEIGHDTQNRVEEISPERVLEGRQRVEQLRNALYELPERTRVIFLLHRFEEFKYSEIAARLGISTSSVEKHMMSAIRHLTTKVARG
jgi:RNA polymerase sigma factor (sigma-70 family)